MSKIDLHIHSVLSGDGEFSVKEILSMSKASGMKLVSIADHNSVKSVSEVLENSNGLCVISGVELDCVHKGVLLHLLGYGFDHTVPDFDIIGEDINKQEREMAAEKIRLFKNFSGIPLDIDEIIATSRTGIITGEVIAEYILAKDYAPEYELLKPYLPGGEKSDMPNAHFYWDFFSQGKPAEVPVRYISLSDAIGLIHKTNGIAVLAHPGKSLSGKYDLLDSIIAEGLDGIEVFCSYHSSEEAAFFKNAAEQNRLFISCGSDFHGKNKPQIQIGGHGATMDDKAFLESIKVLELPFLQGTV